MSYVSDSMKLYNTSKSATNVRVQMYIRPNVFSKPVWGRFEIPIGDFVHCPHTQALSTLPMTSYTKRSTTPANFAFGPFCRHRSRAVNKRTGAKYRRRLCVAAYNLLSLLRVADIGRDEKAGRLENFKPSQWLRERKNGAGRRKSRRFRRPNRRLHDFHLRFIYFVVR